MNSVRQKTKHIRLIDGHVYLVRRGIKIAAAEVYLPRYALNSLVRRARRAGHDALKSSDSRLHESINSRSEGHYFKRVAERRISLVEENKTPESLQKHIGVEIEFLSPKSTKEIKRAFADAGLHRNVTYHSDGSVHGEGNSDNCDGSCRDNCECAYCGDTHYCDDETECARRARRDGGDSWEFRDDCDCGGTEEIDGETRKICNGHCPGHSCSGYDDHNDYDCHCECTCGSSDGHEICVIATQDKIESVIEQVCSVLNDRLDASVNKTCGLHVHLDMRRVKAAQAFRRLVQNQHFLRALVPSSRLSNSFCQPNTTESLESALELDSRYWIINCKSLKKHRTLECRLHSGTTDAVKIISWVRLLILLAYNKKITAQIESFTQLVKLGLPMETVFYLNSRFQKHGKNRDGWKPNDHAQNVNMTNESIQEAA